MTDDRQSEYLTRHGYALCARCGTARPKAQLEAGVCRDWPLCAQPDKCAHDWRGDIRGEPVVAPLNVCVHCGVYRRAEEPLP